MFSFSNAYKLYQKQKQSNRHHKRWFIIDRLMFHFPTYTCKPQSALWYGSNIYANSRAMTCHAMTRMEEHSTSHIPWCRFSQPSLKYLTICLCEEHSDVITMPWSWSTVPNASELGQWCSQQSFPTQLLQATRCPAGVVATTASPWHAPQIIYVSSILNPPGILKQRWLGHQAVAVIGH